MCHKLTFFGSATNDRLEPNVDDYTAKFSGHQIVGSCERLRLDHDDHAGQPIFDKSLYKFGPLPGQSMT